MGMIYFFTWQYTGTQSYLHGWVFMIWCSPSGQFNGCYPKAPDVSLEVIAVHLQIENRTEWTKLMSSFHPSSFLMSHHREETEGEKRTEPPTCSMTSGAIQHGVPTNVFRTLFLVMSPPAARKALTPKSGFEKFETDIELVQSFRWFSNASLQILWAVIVREL